MTIARPRAATSWDLVLDALDARLERATSAPESSDPRDEWTPPSGLGPLPLRLASRAQSILERSDHAMADLDATRHEVGRELATLARRSTKRTPMPASASVDLSV